jgi:hypothetical protein
MKGTVPVRSWPEGLSRVDDKSKSLRTPIYRPSEVLYTIRLLGLTSR